MNTTIDDSAELARNEGDDAYALVPRHVPSPSEIKEQIALLELVLETKSPGVLRHAIGLVSCWAVPSDKEAQS